MLNKLRLTLLASSIVLLANSAQADTWTVDQDKSTLGFSVAQGDNTLEGAFDSWTASIDFDPDAPEAATISAEIQPGSATTGNAQFDGTLPGKDWFDASGFPTATFSSDSVTLVEGNSYRATGTLSIKGISHPVELDFTLEIDGDTAIAKGTAKTNRFDYDLGKGVGADTVGDVVTVSLDLTAVR
ncbi:MAG: YceI family protein [Roseibium sp.]|uniref:YceI family protein n=1 Tax=Roseibium sp. TaxID=1936156 RepID=UPI001B28EFCB|nr:YceI family protein [Roseibium sp.]MBO6891327.1 YceI family protein [Roseibium sp.]MBO6931782.1 YceI family protein [Roseibium sp.]